MKCDEMENAQVSKQSRRQVRAFRLQAELGRKLREEHPEILEMCRKQTTRLDILDSLGLKTKYGATKAVALGAIRKALRGHDGSLDVPSYHGLATEEELKQILTERKRMNGKIMARKILWSGLEVCPLSPEERQKAGRLGGSKTVALKTGIFAYSETQRREVCVKGGLAGGAAVRDRKVGIHAFSREQRAAIAIKANLAMGRKIWNDAEVELASKLSKDPKYKYGDSDNHPGSPNWILIASEINREFHEGKEVRDKNGIRLKVLLRNSERNGDGDNAQ